MRVGAAAVLALLFLGSSASSFQQAKKPKSPLSSGIDSNAASLTGYDYSDLPAVFEAAGRATGI